MREKIVLPGDVPINGWHLDSGRQLLSDPFSSYSAKNPYNASIGQSWQYPGAWLAPRITDLRVVVSLFLAFTLAGLAIFLLEDTIPSLKIARGGATAMGVIQDLQDCGEGYQRPTVAFFDSKGQEHIGTPGNCDIAFILNDTLTIHYASADPGGGILTDSDIGGVYALVILGALSGLAGLICLLYLAFRVNRVGGIDRLSRATLMTGLALLVLLPGSVFVFHPGGQSKTSYRHYQIGETASAPGGWAVTLKSAEAAQVGVDGLLDPNTGCVVFDIGMRNTASKTQTAGEGLFDLYTITGQQLGDCSISGVTLSGDVAPGSILEGQVAFAAPTNARLLWLAFSTDDTDNTETIWDIPGSTATATSATYHHIGETVMVQGLWNVTIKSANPAQIGLDTAPDDGGICLDVDVVMRNTSSEVLKLNNSQFSLYTTQGSQILFPCPLGIRNLDGSVAAGGMAQGEVTFEAPAIEKEFRLAFQAQTDCSSQCPAPTLWDFQAGTGGTSGYHRIGETVNVQGIWSVTITHPTARVDGPPQPGDTCLFVQISALNLSSQAQDLSSDQFMVYDTQGVQLPFPCSLNTALEDVQVSPGDLAQGVIVYEVPESLNQFRVAFQVNPDCEPNCAELDIWTISIG